MCKRLTLVFSILHIILASPPCQSSEPLVTNKETLEAPLPTISITNPMADTVWQTGTTQTITWITDTNEGYAQIEAVTGHGDRMCINFVPVSEGSVTWDIPQYASDSEIHLSWWLEGIPELEFISDPFQITDSQPVPTLTLTSPNGGEIWDAWATHTITWDSTNATGNVYAVLWKGGEPWADIGVAPMADGQMSWDNCPNIIDGTDYTVQIYWNPSCIWVSDRSDAPFEIAGAMPEPLSIITPAVATVWEAGTTQVITWDGDTFEGKMNAHLVMPGGGTSFIKSVPASKGSMIWDICPSIEDAIDYSIILDWFSNCGQATSVRSEPFEIFNPQPVPTITLTSPIGGEVWEAGSMHTVTWESTDAAGDVLVMVYRDRHLGGSSGVDDRIGSAPMSDGQLNWEICPYVGGEGSVYYAGIYWLECRPHIIDESIAPFEIAATLPWPTRLGDADSNDMIDLADFAKLVKCFNGYGVGCARCVFNQFDFDKDRDVDLKDFSAFQINFDG